MDILRGYLNHLKNGIIAQSMQIIKMSAYFLLLSLSSFLEEGHGVSND